MLRSAVSALHFCVSLQVPPLMGGPSQLESSGHPYGADLTGSCTSWSLVNYAPPARYNSNTGYDNACHAAIVSCRLLSEFVLVDWGFSEGPCRTSRE